MRICIFGAGATGGNFAVRLARAGHEVSVIARGPHLEAILANGLRLEAGESVLEARPRAAASGAELGVQDVLVVGVKAPALDGLAEALAPLIGPQTLVVFPQNGMPWWYPLSPAPEGAPAALPDLAVFRRGPALLAQMTPEQVVGGVIYSGNEVSRPGVVVNTTPARNALTIGPATGGPGDARHAALRAALEGAGIGSETPQDIRQVMWRKLMLNICSSALGLATRSVSAETRGDAELSAVFLDMMGEGMAVARAWGFPLEGLVDPQAVLANLPVHRASILQDYEAGRPMEVGEIVLAPLAFARAAGVPAPTLRVVAAIVSRLGQSAGLFTP
ncbi:ketopantoate reductase family protein [Oceanicella sp. SM1341]|uniref:ketopantoate reductase family protein n=1 Tax=Oceanicella sp. SM1341 TaxID=1548889 RepID=UPI000E4D0809|nr:2-dehydropantoate 2-reductase [Oceanicella sp. SM1341]